MTFVAKQQELNNAVQGNTNIPYGAEAIVVVGTGPVGIHFVNELVKRKFNQPVVVYGGEPNFPYDRVKLSSYLAGEINRDSLNLEMNKNTDVPVEMRLNCHVVAIDRYNKTVTDETGKKQSYSKLVLAQGSSAHVPPITNIDCSGVYTFRFLSEADELLARRIRSKHTVVVGGGLLGLETARAMQRFNTQLTVIEHNPWLMMQQLDEDSGKRLKALIEEKNINVILRDSVLSIKGDDRVEAVVLRSGKEIECDTVIIATGVRPNIDLARDTRLYCNKGIRVNDLLKTSDSHIYAIGECTEHDNSIYGLVKPGLEQAAVLADRFTGGDAKYSGSLESTRLKVMDKNVFSAGRTGFDEEARATVKEYIYENAESGVFRKVRVFGNRLIGAVALGEWHESALLQDAIKNKKRVFLWNILRFKTDGNLWGDEDDLPVVSWPASANVCNCASVTRGELTTSISQGCKTIIELGEKTRAGTVCGSCQPLLGELLGENIRQEPVKAWRSVFIMSLIAIALATLFLVIPRVPYLDSVQSSIALGWQWDELWRNSLFKQITGFTVLGLVAIGLLLSFRKRVSFFKVSSFNNWRMVHIVLGICALLVLIAHTGLRMGSELNWLLMVNFLLLSAVGANAGSIVATEHKTSPMIARKKRKQWTWWHILLFWPLPVLLGFHVVKTYYF